MQPTTSTTAKPVHVHAPSVGVRREAVVEKLREVMLPTDVKTGQARGGLSPPCSGLFVLFCQKRPGKYCVPEGETYLRDAMLRLTTGHQLPTQTLQSIRHEFIPIPPNQTPLLHLQFRRFAGCPICNLHLRSIAKRHGELRGAGIQEVAIFHSTAQTMLPFQGDLPFPVIADPEKKLYRQFGVEQGLASVVDPRAWGGLLRGVVASHGSGMMTGEGGHLGLPADFLVNQQGVIVACKYGDHADDQWSVDELLELAASGAQRA